MQLSRFLRLWRCAKLAQSRFAKQTDRTTHENALEICFFNYLQKDRPLCVSSTKHRCIGSIPARISSERSPLLSPEPEILGSFPVEKIIILRSPGRCKPRKIPSRIPKTLPLVGKVSGTILSPGFPRGLPPTKVQKNTKSRIPAPS